MHPKGLGHRGEKRRQQHPRQPAHVDNQLQLVGLVHAHAGVVDAREAPQEIGPEAGLHLVPGLDVVGAHGHDLGPKGQHVPGPGDGQHILAHQFRLVLSPLHKMGLYGKAVVLPPVFSLQGAPVKVDDAVFFPALRFQVPRRNNAHVDASLFLVRISSLLYNTAAGLSI